MPSTKEIRGKIKSVQNTSKITKAMEMVAASKMRKAQERMFQARPYGEKIRTICSHLAKADIAEDEKHPFLVEHEGANKYGLILVTTDKGLAGALNTNIQRLILQKVKEWTAQGRKISCTAIGNKGLGFLQRLGADVVTQVTQLGDRPNLDRLIGSIQIQIEAFKKGEVDKVYLAYTRFVNAMKQEPVIEQLLPLTDEFLSAEEPVQKYSWEYIYEPNAKVVLDELLNGWERFIDEEYPGMETLVDHEKADNIKVQLGFSGEQARRFDRFYETCVRMVNEK